MANFLRVPNLFNDCFDPMDEVRSLQVVEELVDHPDVEVECKLFHGGLEEQVLGQRQVGVQVVNEVVDLVRHEEGVAGTLQDQLGCLAVKFPGSEKLS